MDDLTDQEQAALDVADFYQKWDSGYSKQQSTRPQTLGYGLVDSPAGQCAWIVEKLYAWSDCDGHPENVFGRDRMLDNVMAYWLPGTGASSARLYWESFNRMRVDKVDVPVGCSRVPQGDLPAVAPLGRQAVQRHPVLERTRPRRALRCIRTSRDLRRRGPRRLSSNAVTGSDRERTGVASVDTRAPPAVPRAVRRPRAGRPRRRRRVLRPRHDDVVQRHERDIDRESRTSRPGRQGKRLHRRRTYNDRNINTFDDGFVAQYTMHVVAHDGSKVPLSACLVAEVRDGKIMKLFEYLDSGKFRSGPRTS